MTYQDPSGGNYQQNYQQFPQDFAVPPRSSGMAIASMVLSIIGILTACFLVGVPLALVGMILGIVAVGQINKRPRELGGKGFAITGIIVGAIGFLPVGALVIAILLPSFGRARELSNRGYCAANIRGIMQSCNIYAADNSDTFPVIGNGTEFTAGGTQYDASTSAGTPSAVASSTINSFYTASYPAAPVYQNLWILVLKNQVAPKQFLCKSDPSALSTPAPQTSGSLYTTTFTNGSTVDLSRVSYSVAYPYTYEGQVGGWWRAVTDSTLPLISDMAPLSGEGSIDTTSIMGSPRSYNSRNHGGDGQVVGYSDVHASFERRPDAGANTDNIFTSGGRGGPTPRGEPIRSGGTITPIYTGSSPWDTIMVPVRDASGGTR
jgi:hypothetical protein